MKRILCLGASLLALNLTPVFGQPAPITLPQASTPSSPEAQIIAIEAQRAQRMAAQAGSPTLLPPTPSDAAATQIVQHRLLEILNRANGADNPPPVLTKFNLDFPGGTPAQLVKAIENATGKPLNAIIPIEDANLQMPPLKMNGVVVPQLFAALESASLKQETRNTVNYGYSSYPTVNTGYGFKTEGQVSDDSIWYFHILNPPQPQLTPPAPAKACRFYQLRPYLDSGLTVDDITTAIQAGWKMMGDTSPPEISFHKETKLLIAVGEPEKLEVIENVLKALQPASANPNDVFQHRLLDIIKNSTPATPTQLAPPQLPPTPLVLPNTPVSTNASAEKSGK